GGQKVFSRLVSSTPAGAPGSGSADSRLSGLGPGGWGARAGAVMARSGTSRLTSRAGLSIRRPLYTGTRNSPSFVHPAYSTSTTSSGRTQVTASLDGGTWANGHAVSSRACSRGINRRSSASVKPPPQCPLYWSRQPPSYTQSSTAPKVFARAPRPRVNPPTTASIRCVTLILSQLFP